ncbi:Pectin methylesterase [Butyrivibrio fibrisolvens DSM 3071]|uniref:Pectin methylesterase n=1 Tax=Butyrivibrio fibrisolvens DSM 3071 TaxID=1121131 RepID=A0A1M6GEJ1_BUTFI|nr:pectinesterase family protein [Butyrivibrio fibrisolvens]SHJ08365.1 Pectin methylesterase [Butyrivibrio fibrisolvens DSM 3071]
MKRFSQSKRLQSFILAAMLSMTLLGGSVVTSMAHEGTDSITSDVNETSDENTGSSENSPNNSTTDVTSTENDDASSENTVSNSSSNESTVSNDADEVNSDESDSEKSGENNSSTGSTESEDQTSDDKKDKASSNEESNISTSSSVDVSKAGEASWDFTSTGINAAIEYSATAKTLFYNNLYIDASANGAKYNGTTSNGANGWGQFNAGTVIYFAVPAKSVVTILSYYSNESEMTLTNGEEVLKPEITGDKNPFTFTYEYSGDEAVILKLTINEDSRYLRSLTVSKKAEEVEEPTNNGYLGYFSFPVEHKSWDFTDYDKANHTSYQKNAGTYDDLYIDATAGKFNPRENGGKDDAQVNDKTLIVVPFNRAGTLTVSYVGDGSSFLADGETTLSSGDTYEYTGSGYGYVTLLAKGQLYLYSIEITYPASALDDRGNGEIHVWDFGGKASGIEDSTNEITMSDITSINSIGDYTDSNGNVKASSVTSNTSVSFGDLTLHMGKGDRFYTAESVAGKTYQATSKKGIYTFEDGYTSAGYYYGNGKTSMKKGAPTARYITISNVEEGDTFTLYMGVKFSSSATNTQETAHFKSENGKQDESFTLTSGAPGVYTFTATENGTYTIYTENTNGGKPDFYRIVKGKGSANVLKGTISFDNCDALKDGYKLLFTCTDDENVSDVYADIDYETNRYAVYVKAGHSYKVTITGPVGYTVSDATKNVTAGETSHDITICKAATVSVAGKVSGIKEGYIKEHKSQITFTDSEGNKASAKLSDDGSYEGINIEAGVTYTVSLTDCPDYEIASGNEISVSEETEDADFEAQLINTYKVSGGFIGLPKDADLGTLTFVNTKDKSEYEATILEDNAGYEASLRDGTYKVKVSNKNYATATTVTVDKKDTEKDLFFAKEKSDIVVGDAKDVYVGYTDGRDYNFETVQDAIDAITDTRTNDSDRVTVHINGGTYREQVVINTPNVTLKADGDVKLTWYYGIGYTYYSAKNGYYDEEAAYNKTSKGTVSKWGASTYIKKNATGFKADGITFENSFNLYVTDEEIKDGVTLNTSAYSDSKVNFERTKGADVTSVAATERATALAIEAADAEFNNVTVLGSQDTLYTGPGTRGYFTNSKISGNTDFIFGYGDWLFENSELQFAGYSDGAKKHSYITAARGEGATYGYLFDNSTITGPDEGKTIGTSYLGRPWDEQAKVTFKNTTIKDSNNIKDGLIKNAGWYSMSGRAPYTVTYREYNTIVENKDGSTVVTQEMRLATDGVNKNSTVYESEDELNELGLSRDGYAKLLGWEPTLMNATEEEPTVKYPTKDPAEDPTVEDPAEEPTDNPAVENPTEEDPTDDSSNANTGSSTSNEGSTEATNGSTNESSAEATNGSTSESTAEATNDSTNTSNESSTAVANTDNNSASQNAANTGSASSSQNDVTNTTSTASATESDNESAVLGASRDQETATVNNKEAVSDSNTNVSGTRLASTGDDTSIPARLAIIMLACFMVVFIIERQEREEKHA